MPPVAQLHRALFKVRKLVFIVLICYVVLIYCLCTKFVTRPTCKQDMRSMWDNNFSSPDMTIRPFRSIWDYKFSSPDTTTCPSCFMHYHVRIPKKHGPMREHDVTVTLPNKQNNGHRTLAHQWQTRPPARTCYVGKYDAAYTALFAPWHLSRRRLKSKTKQSTNNHLH